MCISVPKEIGSQMCIHVLPLHKLYFTLNLLLPSMYFITYFIRVNKNFPKLTDKYLTLYTFIKYLIHSKYMQYPVKVFHTL